MLHQSTFEHYRERWLPTVSDWESLIAPELDQELQAYMSKAAAKSA